MRPLRRFAPRLLAALALAAPFAACADGKTGPGNLLATNQLCESGTLDIDERCRCCSNRATACAVGSSCAPADASIECGDRCPAELTCFDEKCQLCAVHGETCGENERAACCTCWEELGARSCPAGEVCDCTTSGGGGTSVGGAAGSGGAAAAGGSPGTGGSGATPSSCDAPCEPGAYPCLSSACGPDELCMQFAPDVDLCVRICTDPVTGEEDESRCAEAAQNACGAVPACELQLESIDYPEPIMGCVLRCEDDDACPGGQTCRELEGERACLP